jgi:NDP-mannose synthase
MNYTAVILCGGVGARLKPYTNTFPKPLMPLGDIPVLEVIIRQLKKNNFKRIILAVNHKADLLKLYFEKGKKFGVKIEYSLEKNNLGTMGPLKIIKNLPDNFLVMNGDVLTTINYKKFFESHINNNANFTISSTLRYNFIDYGVLEKEKNLLKSFIEKPNKVYEVSMGIYAINKKIIKYVLPKTNYGFDKLVLNLLKRKIDVNIIKYNGKWFDIGRSDDYDMATQYFLNNKNKFI